MNWLKWCARYRWSYKEIKALSERYGLAVDPSAKIADISVGAQQRVEILKPFIGGWYPYLWRTNGCLDSIRNWWVDGYFEKSCQRRKINYLDHPQVRRDSRSFWPRYSYPSWEINWNCRNCRATNADLAEMMVGRSVSFKTEKQASPTKRSGLVNQRFGGQWKSRCPSCEKSFLGCSVLERLLVLQGLMEMVSLNWFKPLQVFARLNLVALAKGDSIVGLHPRQITELSVGHVPEDRHRDGLILKWWFLKILPFKPTIKNHIVKWNFELFKCTSVC